MNRSVVGIGDALGFFCERPLILGCLTALSLKCSIACSMKRFRLVFLVAVDMVELICALVDVSRKSRR